MKVKRHKKVRKVLQFYKISFGLKPPYRIAMDGEFLQAALEGRVQLKEQMPKLLQQDTSIYSTQCVLHELMNKGKHYSGALKICKQQKFLRCNHTGKLPSAECIELLVANDNPDHLIVGAQDVTLRNLVRKMPNVPLIFIRGNVPILESPSEESREAALNDVKEKTEASKTEKKLSLVSQASEEKTTLTGNGMPKRHKAKGANPLSVKKKRKLSKGPNSQNESDRSKEEKLSEAARRRQRRKKTKLVQDQSKEDEKRE